MAALLVAVALLAVALAFMLKARTERNRRLEAERRAARLERSLRDSGAEQAEWLSVLGHELRSPVAAILGYGELLADGAFGELDGRAADAVHRVRSAADQLLGLIEGVETQASDRDEPPVSSSIGAAAILHSAVAALAAEAEARQVRLTVAGDDVRFATHPQFAERTLRLALGAAIKVSSGASLRLLAEQQPEPRMVITGTRLDPLRDDPDRPAEGGAARVLTGAGLRIALARRTARRIGAGVSLHATSEGTRVHITVPSRSD